MMGIMSTSCLKYLFLTKNERATNLKVGVGKPCAGQLRLRVKSFLLDTLKPSVLTLNLGIDPPIGSKRDKGEY